MADCFFKVSVGVRQVILSNRFQGKLRTLYLVEGFGVSPVVTLCILKNASGANLDTVASKLVSQGLYVFLVLLDRQQGQGSKHRGRKENL